MAKHAKKVNLAFDRITNFQNELALAVIQDLTQEDLENSSLGVTKQWYLFDWAVVNGLMDVANAIIERYAFVTKDRWLKPLLIDYYVTDDNTIRYTMNTLNFMSSSILSQYLMLIDEHKMIFVYKIEVEIKKFRLIALEKLLELTVILSIDNRFRKALTSYKEISIHLIQLNKLIVEAMSSLSCILAGTITYQELFTSIKTADQLDEVCAEFNNTDHYSIYSLEKYRSKIYSILNHPTNNILKQDKEYKAALTRIADIAIGSSVAVVVNKSKEPSNSQWTFFSKNSNNEEQEEYSFLQSIL